MQNTHKNMTSQWSLSPWLQLPSKTGYVPNLVWEGQLSPVGTIKQSLGNWLCNNHTQGLKKVLHSFFFFFDQEPDSLKINSNHQIKYFQENKKLGNFIISSPELKEILKESYSSIKTNINPDGSIEM